MWRDKGDEENEKKRKKWLVTVREKWKGRNTLDG